jgi:AcrR family transcriptional regulator
MGKVAGTRTGGVGGYGRLDRGVILDAALRIAARPGSAEIRFRELGEALRADPTAVYRHFRSKRELMEALIERLMERIVGMVRSSDGWREVLTAMATGILEEFTSHPAVGLHLAEARPVGASELVLVERVLAALEDAGLSGDALITHYGALSGFAVSYVAASCRELLTAGATSVDVVEGMAWLPGGLTITAQSHPAVLRYAEQLGAMNFRSTYSATIGVLIEAAAQAGRPPGGEPG